MENVPQFKKSQEYAKLVRETRSKGALAGYELQDFVIRAHDHGTPQSRRRAIIVGRKKGEPAIQIPAASKEISLRKALKGLSLSATPHDKWVKVISTFTETSAFGGTCLQPGETRRIEGPYSGTATLHVQGPLSAKLREMVRNIPEGGGRLDLPEELQYDCWKRGTYNGSDVMGRLSWDKPSVTIRTQFYKPDKGRFIHPTEHRTITYAEAARIQGFPDNYIWYGGLPSIAKQIGNAVPVPLGKMLGLAVFTAQPSVGVDTQDDTSRKPAPGRKTQPGNRSTSAQKKRSKRRNTIVAASGGRDE